MQPLVEQSGRVGDAEGEGINLFFTTDDEGLRADIDSGILSIGILNNTANTPRAGLYAIGAIGRGRLAIGGRVRWTCASGGSGEASSCLQAALDCAAACPGGLANCTVDCFDPPVISWVPDISFLPDLVRVGPGVTIPGSWEGYTPNPADPDPWPWPQFSGKMRIPEVIPSWGHSVVVDTGKALLDLDLPFFQVGDWAMVIEFANGEIVELKDFIEDGLDLDGSGLVGDGDGEGLSLFFHTSDPKLAARLDAGGFQVGLRNRTAGTPRQGEYAILDFGRGRVLSGIWFFGSVSWTAHCNAPGSEPVYGHAPNVLRAQIDCEAACRGSGGVLRCDIDGEPLPLPWFEDEYILPEILRVDPRELPDIKDILPVPGETPEPVDPAWGISVFFRFDVLETLVDIGTEFFDPDDFALVFGRGDPNPQPSAPLPADLAAYLFLDRPVQEFVDLDQSGRVGDAAGEGINLFFTTDDEGLRAEIDSGILSIGILNNTANTPRAGLYAIGAIGRGRLAERPEPGPGPGPEPVFRRGDVDGNGKLEITDAILNLDFQFIGNYVPRCKDAHDFDDNGRIEITDSIANLQHQFVGGQGPAPPGMKSCGKDPSDDTLPCENYLSAGCQ